MRERGRGGARLPKALLSRRADGLPPPSSAKTAVRWPSCVRLKLAARVLPVSGSALGGCGLRGLFVEGRQGGVGRVKMAVCWLDAASAPSGVLCRRRHVVSAVQNSELARTIRLLAGRARFPTSTASPGARSWARRETRIAASESSGMAHRPPPPSAALALVQQASARATPTPVFNSPASTNAHRHTLTPAARALRRPGTAGRTGRRA